MSESGEWGKSIANVLSELFTGDKLFSESSSSKSSKDDDDDDWDSCYDDDDDDDD